MSFKRRVSALKKGLLKIGHGLEPVTTRMGVEELRDALTKSKRAKLDAIHATKNGKEPDAKQVLPFRGAQ